MNTEKFAWALHEPFEVISTKLSKDYGGIIENLWIDFQLIEHLSSQRKPYPFRFQKRVSGKANSKLIGGNAPDKFNVGHYSVAPDFLKLSKMKKDDVVDYALKLIYESTTILIEKKKRLGGFDAERFREDFKKECLRKGFVI